MTTTGSDIGAGMDVQGENTERIGQGEGGPVSASFDLLQKAGLRWYR
jgi:hypothetical protein